MASTENDSSFSIKEKKLTVEESQVNGDVEETSSLTAAQRARAERNRQKACALREARLVQRPK